MFTHLHPATVHFPIALLLLATGAGLFYLYGQKHEVLRVLTWWPLLFGWLGNSIAIVTGLFAQSGLPPQAPYRPILNRHVTTGFLLWVLVAFLLYRWWLHSKAAKRSSPRNATPAPIVDLLDVPAARLWLTALLIAIIALVFVSGWNGGQLVYEWGVNVH